jgi:hypothetical protein
MILRVSIIPEAQARVYWTMVWLHEEGPVAYGIACVRPTPSSKLRVYRYQRPMDDSNQSGHPDSGVRNPYAYERE